MALYWINNKVNFIFLLLNALHKILKNKGRDNKKNKDSHCELIFSLEINDIYKSYTTFF